MDAPAKEGTNLSMGRPGVHFAIEAGWVIWHKIVLRVANPKE